MPTNEQNNDRHRAEAVTQVLILRHPDKPLSTWHAARPRTPGYPCTTRGPLVPIQELCRATATASGEGFVVWLPPAEAEQRATPPLVVTWRVETGTHLGGGTMTIEML
jgi:hypothetical protein